MDLVLAACGSAGGGHPDALCRMQGWGDGAWYLEYQGMVLEALREFDSAAELTHAAVAPEGDEQGDRFLGLAVT